jgi:cell wall-associated NlpC family hydrolase
VVRRRLLLSAGPAVLIVVVVAAALASSGGSRGARAGAATSAQPAYEELPTRNTRARAVEPVAGETAASAALPTEVVPDQPAAAGRGGPTPLPRATKRRRPDTGPTDDAAISKAEVLKNGIALPPFEAPQPVRDIIEAGNSIARTPYLWGGGHGKWLDKGYDCSGSISYALAAGGLLSGPLDSGRLMRWGEPGPGKWVTIYTNPGHVYMVVAGVRFDTTGRRSTGSRWQSTMRPSGGFVARHPRGL